jgi:predicted outer membrane repeat protein
LQVAITGDSIFLNNTDSVKGGGGIYASGNAFVQVQDVLARNNSNGGEEFGGGFIRAIGNASIELVNCTLEGNFGGGAGAFVRDNASVSVKGGSLIDNVSPEGYAGGVFYLLGNGTLSIQGPCLLQGNQADYGAAIYADSNSRLYIGSDVAFKQNRANLHATLYIEGSVVANLYGSNISFVDNHAELNGGAIYADSDSIVNITGSSMTFSDNQATASGGAIFMSDYAQLSMEPQLPVFVNNSAVVGGVMYAGPNNKVFVSNRSFLSEPDVSWLRKQCLLGEVLMHKGICVKCPPDSYSFNTTAHRCDLCPEHAKCGGGSHVAPVAGYWHSTAQSVQLHACPNAAACEAGGTCAEGYAGPVCGSCTEGYGLREPFQCSQCHGAGRSVGLYLAGWVVMVSLVVYTWHNTARDNQQATRGVRPSDILKVLIPFCQYLAILSCLNVSWPRSMVAVLNGLSQLFGMGHVAFVDCLVNQGLARPGTPLAVQRLLLSLFTPCAVLVAAVLLHLLVWLVLRFMLHKPRLTFRAYFWDRVVIIVLTVLFMFYPNFVRAGTSSFACFHLDVAGEGPYPQYSTATAQHGYFVFDLQQECYRGYHLVLVLALAVPTALFFCVIVPLGIWAGLYFNRSSLSHRKVRQQYGSLYHAYKQQYYYWESIVCVQTVLLVCIAVFSSELGVFYSALLLNAAFVGSLLLQVAFRPYACRMVHQLQMQASACLYLVTLLALTLLSLDRESPPTYQEAAGVVVLLLIICFVLSCCWRIHCILKEQGLIMRMVWPVVRWLRRRLVACGCKKTSLPLTSLASTTSATHVALNSMPSMVSAASVSVAQGKMMPDDSGVQPAALPAGALADDVCDDGVHDGVHDGAHDGVLPGGCLDDASDSLGVFYTAQHKEGKLPEQQHCNDEVGMQADKDVDG